MLFKKQTALDEIFFQYLPPFLFHLFFAKKKRVEPKGRGLAEGKFLQKRSRQRPERALPRCYFKREKALCLLQLILLDQLLHMFRAVDRDDLVVDNDAGDAGAMLLADLLAGVRGVANFEELF